jgi:dihydrofolate synthase/folylpolyglutamate synthase
VAARSAAALLTRLEPLGVRLALDDYSRLLAELGEPHRATPAVIVAGTNGKGSVSALLASIAAAAGLRTGLYTSPHLERWEERIRVDGEAISEPDLVARLDEVLAVVERAGLPLPTVFEAVTAAAFLHFARRKLDLAVLEVGLGGRLDATNVGDPHLSVVTRIALDHREYLGDSLESIAREKAGVFRVGRPALIAPQTAEAARALAEEARRLGSDLHRVDEETSLENLASSGSGGQRLDLRTPLALYHLTTALAGDHQLENVATAVRAAELLGALDRRLDRRAIVAGVAAARWPGRLELVDLAHGKPPVLLDAAHNPDGCRALARFLAQLGRPLTLVFGCLADKAATEMLAALAPLAGRIVLTRPTSPRARAPEELVEEVPPGPAVEVAAEPAAALARALTSETALVVVAGSIVLVGEIRRRLRESYGAALVG